MQMVYSEAPYQGDYNFVFITVNPQYFVCIFISVRIFYAWWLAHENRMHTKSLKQVMIRESTAVSGCTKIFARVWA